MVTLIRYSLVAVAASFLLSQPVYAASKWEGRATNMAGDFRYGKVTFTLQGNTMKNFIIEGVTTNGCGGYKSVIVPRIKVRGNRFSAKYVPIPGIDDTIVVNGTFRGKKVTGLFAEGPLCQNKGKFSATKK